jgi:glycerol transport system ATP-binding protein
MAKIGLKALRHSYMPNPSADEDWALRQIDLDWDDGGAYALLGPSGCGKTTLLNIISGLVKPTEGQVLFDGRDVTALPPDQRNIAQVFQFPVIYDTMTVYNNLAFPLRNRGIDEARVDARVREIADMLELTEMLGQRASGLSADGKQKISMGRGLVREDVNVVMFDEPLTVIDPHLKWKLRSKLKELHQKVRVTMIYVTHDQTEALRGRGGADRHPGRAVRAPGAYFRRAFYWLARDERPALRGPRRRRLLQWHPCAHRRGHRPHRRRAPA